MISTRLVRLAFLAPALLALSTLAPRTAAVASPGLLPAASAGAKQGASSRPVVQEEVVKMTASDGQAVPGWYREAKPKEAKEGWRKQAHAVVLLHMYRSDHTAWEPILGKFAKQGVSTLAIDMRGHGANTRGPKNEDLAKRMVERDEALFQSMYKDAFAAIAMLEKRGFQRGHISLLGASVGCSVAIDAARRMDGLGPVAVMTPGLNYLGVNTEEQIKEWGTRELLIVTSTEEAGFGPAPLRDALRAAYAERKESSPEAVDHLTYWEIDQEGIHGTRMFGKVDGIEGRIVDWFVEHFAERAEPTSRPTAR